MKWARSKVSTFSPMESLSGEVSNMEGNTKKVNILCFVPFLNFTFYSQRIIA